MLFCYPLSFLKRQRFAKSGSITACDIHPHRVELIRRGAARLGLEGVIGAQTNDAAVSRPDWQGRFDVVLYDVPCSGFGVIRKKPDIRYKELAPTEALPELQLAIMEAQAGHVRAGGVLLYSTCTLLRRENEDVVSAFLARHPDFSPESFPLPGLAPCVSGMKTLLPCVEGTDGFFIARLRKRTQTP